MSVNLEKTHCSEDPEVQSVLHHDCTVDGVTYRVWSAFLGRKRAEESLGELMLRQLERGMRSLPLMQSRPRASQCKSRKMFFVQSYEISCAHWIPERRCGILSV
jgi:hypothetical protein